MNRPRGAWVPSGIRPEAALSVLSMSLLAIAAALLALARDRPHQPPTWWAISLFVLAFAAAEATQLHMEFRRETFSTSVSELPLVLGLYALAPRDLVLARLAGAALVFASRRTPSPKTAFNLALFAAETATAAVLFSYLVPARGLTPHDLVLTYVCVAAAEIVSTLAVLLGIAIIGVRLTGGGLYNAIASVAVAGTLNTTLALVVVMVVRVNSAGVVLLSLIAVIVVLAYRTHSNLLRKHTSLGQLYELSRELSGAAADGDITTILARRCPAVLRAERVVLRAPADAASDSMLAQVIRAGTPRVLSRRNRHASVRKWLTRHRLRDAVLAPLNDGAGVSAVLQVENRVGEMSTFTEDDARMLETITTHAEAALRASRLLAQLRHDAQHDALTGLGNRTLLFGAIDVLLSRDEAGTVLLLDLDRFKEVNDALGHRIGDLLLGEVSHRLSALLPPDATLVRLGGDEFAALLPSTRSASRAKALAQALRTALQQPFDVDRATLEVGASIGVAVMPEHGRDAVTLLQHADVAMYAAKRAATGVAVYSSDEDIANLRRLALSRELRRGIETGEVAVYYQPKVALGTGEVKGVEALVRWHHRDRGLVRPDEFIPVAEQTGLITLLTDEVLRTALRQVRSWLDSGTAVGVSVNLSARGLHEPGLVRRIGQELTTSRVPAELLTLEITESSVMTDFERAADVLEELVSLGVSLSLDDFGTGYSSLAYLQRLPVREIKIDKTFIMAMETQVAGVAIVRAVIDLSHTLGMEVVAEGVETDAVRQLLTDMGCDAMQGFLLTRPLPGPAVTEWLNAATLRIPGQPGHRSGGRRLRIVS